MGGFVKINLLWTLLTIPMGLLSLWFYLFKSKPKLDLKNKVVFITGASSGLGKACAEAFFKAGCKVILSGRSRETLEKVKQQLLRNAGENTIQPAILVMDLEDLQSIPGRMKEALSLFGQINILINNAGMSSRGLACDTSLEIYQKVMNLNFYAQIQVTKAVLPQMIKNKSGHIVVISSLQSLFGLPGRTAYSASKHAVDGYFDSLRAELAVYNIDVCVLNPYYIKTNLSVNAVCSDGSNYGEMDKATEKGMEPSDVATQVVDCVINRTEVKILSPLYVQLGVCMRTMAPSLMFKYMERRSRKEHLAICKRD